jgi:hypothetical protein
MLEWFRESGASRVTELGVRNAVSSWAFAHYAVEAVYGGARDVTYRALDITRQPGVAPLEAALTACPRVHFTYVEGDDLVEGPWSSDALLIDTFHAFKQLALELPRWAPYTRDAIFLHDTILFADVDEQDWGHGGKPVVAEQYAAAGVGTGLAPAIARFLNSTDGADWALHTQRPECHGLTVLKRKAGFERVRE